MLPLAAYADRLSVRPGETIRFHVANATGTDVHTDVVRVICSDANPAGPGIQVEPTNTDIATLATPGPQTVPHGSYFRADDIALLDTGKSFSFAARVFPTMPGTKLQTIASTASGSPDNGFTLFLNKDGQLAAAVSNGDGETGCATNRALAQRRWHTVWLRYDADAHDLSIGWVALDQTMLANSAPGTASMDVPSGALGHPSTLLVGASNTLAPSLHFNGKLEAPSLWDSALSDSQIDTLAAGEELDGALHAWDFSSDAASSNVPDTGAHGCHGHVINTPVRAVTGSKWSGREMRFSDAPQEFAAIHFHDDDLDDCLWPATYEWTVPQGTRSSVYALQLEAGDARENVPFHVVPPRGKRTAKIAVLASTFTYVIYANHTRPEWDTNPDWRQQWIDQANDWGCYPHNPGDHREYALSTYNNHPDGAGISLSSPRRPMLTVRIGFLTYPGEAIRGSGLRHFPADSHLNAWLESQGHDYDIVTDWELHREGVDVLKGYDVVLTGSHPEYHTRETLSALTQYRDGGGRFCYLGGNGFYWKVALDPEKEGTIEIRRGEGGIRAWAAEPGEYYNQFDGEYGGLWRRNGRPPQDLAGVGFTAQGNFSGSYYRKREQAADDRVSWMFDGVDTDTFGDHGLSAHGAAGFELDRADKRLGTPVHAVVVASSENHPPEAPWILVPEEMLTHIVTWPGEAAKDLIRADMTFFETPAGGAVFSVGSITFCGSLLTNNSDNDVSRLMNNVINRFVDPTPFAMPDA
jgi:N,N-dimethylformamidase